MIYTDFSGEELNIEAIPSVVFSELPNILKDGFDTIEIGDLYCSRETIKKLFDAYILDHDLAICLASKKAQNLVRMENTLDEYEEYTTHLITVEDIKHDSIKKNYVEYVRVKTSIQVSLQEVYNNEVPLIILIDKCHTTEYSPDDDPQVTSRIYELYSQENMISRPNAKVYDHDYIINEVFSTPKSSPVAPDEVMHPDIQELSNLAHPSKETASKEDIYNYLDSEDLTFELNEVEEKINSVDLNAPILDNPELEAPLTIDDDYYSALEPEFASQNVTDRSQPGNIDLGEASEEGSSYQSANESDHDSSFDDENLKACDSPLSGKTNVADDVYYNEKLAAHSKLYSRTSHNRNGSYDSGSTQKYESDYYHSDLVLAVPTSTPYFPDDEIHDFKVRNPILKQAILQLFHNYEVSTDPQSQIVVAFFFVKDPNFKKIDLIRSENDIYFTGVTGRIVSYSLFNDLSSGSNEQELSLNIEVIERIKIDTLYLPEFVPRDDDFRRYQGVSLNKLVTLVKVKPYPHTDLCSDRDFVPSSILVASDETMKSVRKYTNLSLDVLKKLLRLFRNDLDPRLQKFKSHFEESFEVIFSKYGIFNDQYNSNNVLDFFSCNQDTMDLIVIKNHFLIELIKRVVNLKYEFYYKVNKMLHTQDDNDLFSSLYNNSKREYFSCYNTKLQEIQACQEYSRSCKLIYKLIKNELSILKYENSGGHQKTEYSDCEQPESPTSYQSFDSQGYPESSTHSVPNSYSHYKTHSYNSSYGSYEASQDSPSPTSSPLKEKSSWKSKNYFSLSGLLNANRRNEANINHYG